VNDHDVIDKWARKVFAILWIVVEEIECPFEIFLPQDNVVPAIDISRC
jgi:hypothetical protein